MNDWQEQLDRAIARRAGQVRQVRRHLHAHPELSGDERETSLYLYQLLGDEGFEVRMGPEGRGVVADLACGDGQSRGMIALRADIDALRIQDAKEVPYRSQREGVMHACGHDAHSALVTGALLAVADMSRQGQLPWGIAVRGIFQPAEETCQGAKEMIAVGALEGVQAILATHVDPMRAVGHVGIRPGVLTAACDQMYIRIQGRGGHAARPHETSDPIAAAAQLISALYQFIPRATDSQDAVVVSIGQIVGGDNANVIPEQVQLGGTIRTLDDAVRRKTFDHVRQLAAGVGQTTGTKIHVEFTLGSASVKNDAGLIELIRRVACEVVGQEGIDEIARPSMGSEDFAFYLETTPGAMIRLGCCSAKAGGSPLHSPTFDIDEQVLEIGARILAGSVVRWSEPCRRGC